MSISSSQPLTAATLTNVIGKSLLGGGTNSVNTRSSIDSGAALNNANVSELLGLSSGINGNSASPLLANGYDGTAFKGALTAAILGNSSSGTAIGEAAALGATLNAMAKTAQQALAATDTVGRTKALTTYQALYSSLDQASVNINGEASNAATLGLASPGDWADSDLSKGAQAITTDLAAVVHAYGTVGAMIRSDGTAWTQALLFDQTA